MNGREVINTYDQMKSFGGDRVAIIKQNADRGRMSISSGWCVHRVKDGVALRTRKDAPWYDNGRKVFLSHGYAPGNLGVSKALEAAIAWTEERFGERDFVRNRIGDYVERVVNDRFPIRRHP